MVEQFLHEFEIATLEESRLGDNRARISTDISGAVFHYQGHDAAINGKL